MDTANHNAQQAIAYDKAGHLDAAIYFYLEAARCINHLIECNQLPLSAGNVAKRYLDRAEVLRNESSRAVAQHVKSEHELNAEKANFLLNEAFEKDENGNLEEAQKLYTQAVEFCLKCVKRFRKFTQCKSSTDENSQKFRQLALNALEKAEEIKRICTGNCGGSPSNLSSTFLHSASPDGAKTGNVVDLDNLPEFPPVPTNELSTLNVSHKSTDAEAKRPAIREEKSTKLDDDELKVLAFTSKINNKFYVPFMECDLKERFAFTIPFCDGLLTLSEEQRKRFRAWMRPDEFMEAPTIIDCVDSGTIKQTIVSDCSFIASLAISARYERRFGKRLITNIIYPQNKNGVPVHNPCGKYMIRLHINGIWRKVLIDDRLPVGKDGQLLCSYSQNKNELWVSLLEKAYMKVMGGYDFPGSNSNIDMNALTGWIPERIPIRKNADEFPANKVFERLFTRFHSGDCLITLATGQLPESEQERTGLVDAHAYAVLDLRKFKDKRLLLLKNPWTHLRWKGRFSERDQRSWTPDICAALDYNPQDAQQFDNGVFWIDYESVCAFFDVFCVNWNPKLFPFRYALHSCWHAGVGPVKDLYTIGDNPQYYLEINNNQQHGIVSVWILLTRHITEKKDFADNKEYITLMVYKSGKRIYLPHDPKPIIDGSRINSPHYLCQMLVKDAGLNKFTLVVAQYEKRNTIFYTLRIYSSAEFKCTALKVPYKISKKESGEWRGKTAGGCGVGESINTCMNNPIYHVSLDNGSDDNSLLIEIRGPKEFSVGFDVVQVSAIRTGSTRPFQRRDTGAFRPGYTVLQIDSVPAGVYAIRPMTFEKNQEGPFFLRVDSTCNFSFKRVQ